MPTYNLQCLTHGYCGQVNEGHPLYEKCVEREKAGFIDALMVNNDPENCYECRAAKDRLNATNLDFWEERCTTEMRWDGPLSQEEAEEMASLLDECHIKPGCFLCPARGNSWRCKKNESCKGHEESCSLES